MSLVNKAITPLPAKGLAHAVVLFPTQPHELMTKLVEGLKASYPLLKPLDKARWGVTTKPRVTSFGELEAEVDSLGHLARWHILVDSQGVAPEVKQAIIEGAQAGDERYLAMLDEAQTAVLVFLLDDGERPSQSLTRLQALCYPVWELLLQGASVVAFPEGRTILGADTLRLISVSDLGPGHSYLFVSNGVAHREDGLIWCRTYGMAQFGLPDLCRSVASHLEGSMDEELTQTRLIFETLPPEMIAVGGVLPIGGTVAVGERVFKAARLPENAPSMPSRYGFCYLE